MSTNFYIDLSVEGGGSSGVTSLNTLTGALTLVAGTNIALTPSGNNITIAAAGGGSGSPGSPSTSMQYNAAGSFAGSSLLTPDAGVSFGNYAYSFGILQNSFPSAVNFGSPWIGAFASFTVGALAPNNLNNAMHLVTTGNQVDGIYINASSSGSNTFTMSCYMKSNGAGGEQIYFGSVKSTTSFNTANIDVFSTAFTLTTSWQRYIFTGFTPTSAAQAIGFWTKSATGTADFLLWAPQLETNAYAGVFLPTYSNSSGGPPVFNGMGLATSFANIGQLVLGTPLSPFQLDPIGGSFGGNPHRLSYNTASDYLQYQDNSGTSRQVAIVGGGGHTISSISNGSLSGGTASVFDATVTASSFISLMITSASSPGVYQITPNSGSFSVQSYNTGFSGINGSDNSSFTYVVIN